MATQTPTTGSAPSPMSTMGTTTSPMGPSGIQQFGLDDYIIQDIDNRQINQVDYNSLNTLLQSQGVRISRKNDAATRITSTRGQTLNGEYFIRDLRFPQGFGTQGIHSFTETMTPEIGETSFFVVEQQKQATSMLEIKETKKQMINYLIFSVSSSKPVLIVQRPFKSVFSKIYVYDGQGTYFGTVTKRAGILSSKLLVSDPQGSEIMSMKTSKSHGWSDLWVKDLGTREKSGLITTKWSGGSHIKKGVNFETLDLLFPTNAKLSERCMLLAAGLFVDMLLFD